MTSRDTRQKLIDTAIDLIWQSSYGAVSVDDICRAADVKKGSFYHYFPSKSALAVALLDFMFEEGRAEMDACFSPDVPPLERFTRLTDMWLAEQRDALAQYGRVCGCPFTSIGSEMAVQDDIICAKVQEMITRIERYFESALRDAVAEGLLPEGLDIKAKASEIYSYGIGAETMARIQNSLAPLEDIKRGIDNILRPSAQT